MPIYILCILIHGLWHPLSYYKTQGGCENTRAHLVAMKTVTGNHIECREDVVWDL